LFLLLPTSSFLRRLQQEGDTGNSHTSPKSKTVDGYSLVGGKEWEDER
jgi:hypothetical protein